MQIFSNLIFIQTTASENSHYFIRMFYSEPIVSSKIQEKTKKEKKKKNSDTTVLGASFDMICTASCVLYDEQVGFSMKENFQITFEKKK